MNEIQQIQTTYKTGVSYPHVKHKVLVSGPQKEFIKNLQHLPKN